MKVANNDDISLKRESIVNQTYETISETSVEELRLMYTVYFFKRHKVLNIFQVLSGVVVVLCGTLLLLVPGGTPSSSWAGDGQLAALLILLAVIIGYIMLNRARITAKTVYKRHMKSNLPTRATMKITETGIEVTTEQVHSFIRWNQVTSGYFYKNHIFIFCGNTIFSINLDKVTVGSAGELLEFVKGYVPLK